jgi:hypothetical protein
MRTTPFELRLAIIRRVFGVQWLLGQSRHPAEKSARKNRSSKRRPHPLQSAWKKVNEDLRPLLHERMLVYLKPFDLRQSEALTFIEKVANALYLTHNSAQFANAVLPRLLNPSQFASALHECEVASWFAKGGLGVDFVPPEPQPSLRSADLRVEFQGKFIEVECKQKDPITLKQVSGSTIQWFYKQCRSLLEKQSDDLEAHGYVIGPADETTLTYALQRIESLMSQGFRGVHVESDMPMYFRIIDSPSEIPIFTKPQYNTWAESRGCIVARSNLSPIGDGTYYVSNHRGMGICPLDGHTLDQVEASIKCASGQLSPKKLGIVVINIDFAGGTQLNGQQEIYLHLLSDAISHRTWGGGLNTRIGAIVLKLCPCTKEVRAGNCIYNTGVTMFSLVCRPGLTGPNKSSPSGLINSLVAASNCAGQ